MGDAGRSGGIAALDKISSVLYYIDMNKNGVESCDPFRLVEALVHSGKFTEAHLDAALGTVGLSAAKWSVLKQLAEAGESLPLGQLAEKQACVKSNITQLVDRLEADHLVRRTPDPEDRRSVRAELTAAGRQRYEMGLQVVRDFERQLLEDYSPEEQLLLRKLLSRLEGSGRVLA
jgi:DNA-binding MarR family transcriptional regulator